MPSIYFNKGSFYVTYIFLIYVFVQFTYKHNYLKISNTTKLLSVCDLVDLRAGEISKVDLKVVGISVFKGNCLHCGITMIAEPWHAFIWTQIHIKQYFY